MRETMLPEAALQQRKKRSRPKGSGTVYSCVWRWIL